ncbi:hypothetical protein BJX68DRAFT_152463 [Aspergillus pseudodeflectus]|uniref:Uncharacterized protein n=1 Tax=Aspergillus pseudodeflectus TaxID=176178 RepID=A0ABR4JVD9_9EURO
MTRIFAACMKYLQLPGGERRMNVACLNRYVHPEKIQAKSCRNIFFFFLNQNPRYDSLAGNLSFQGIFYLSCPISNRSCTFLLTQAVRCAIGLTCSVIGTAAGSITPMICLSWGKLPSSFFCSKQV